MRKVNMAKNKLDLPSMLSFERKLETSDALMFSGKWSEENDQNKWKDIPIKKRQNRATQSGYGTSDENKTKPNPVSSNSDDANLPIDGDTLKISFSLRVIGNLGEPFGCNSPEFNEAIKNKVEDFKLGDNIYDLAFRYAYNVANGRFLWRNRVGAEDIIIKVRVHGEDDILIFNAYDFSLNDFHKNCDNTDLNDFAKKIEKGLLGDKESFVLIEIDAFVKLGCLQHVFPSQEMNMNEKGKSLFRLNECAAIHNVKIGNAVRTIDTWYSRYSEVGRPIAIEPFGSVTQRGEAYRKNKKEGDFYSLMIDWVSDTELDKEQQSYVVANLIRGGVFSKKSKKKG